MQYHINDLDYIIYTSIQFTVGLTIWITNGMPKQVRCGKHITLPIWTRSLERLSNYMFILAFRFVLIWKYALIYLVYITINMHLVYITILY